MVSVTVVDTLHNYLQISQVPTSSKGMTQFQKLGKEVQVFHFSLFLNKMYEKMPDPSNKQFYQTFSSN